MDLRTATDRPAPRSRLCQGWVVVAAAFAITFVGFGSAYTFSAFVAPLERDFGASRGLVSLVFSVAAFVYTGAGAIAGPLADRFGARRFAIAGMALLGAGMIVAGCATTLAGVCAAYGVGVGVGFGCAYVPALGAVQRWFVSRRGLATGLAVGGSGVGTLVMPVLASALVARFEWRTAYVVLGVLAMAVGIAAAALLADHPSGPGVGPDDREPGLAAPASHRAEGLSIAAAVRTVRFFGLYAGCLAGALGAFVPFVHLVPYAVGHGVAPTTAAFLLGAVGVGGTVGRFFLGGIADRTGSDVFLTAMYAGMAASLALWAVAADLPALVAFALAFGLFYGGWAAILPAAVADHFGERHVGAIIGVLFTSGAIGALVGPSAAGFMYDASHSYGVAIAASAAVNAIAAALTIATARSASPIAVKTMP